MNEMNEINVRNMRGEVKWRFEYLKLIFVFDFFYQAHFFKFNFFFNIISSIIITIYIHPKNNRIRKLSYTKFNENFCQFFFFNVTNGGRKDMEWDGILDFLPSCQGLGQEAQKGQEYGSQ